jgi:hypothetical protein
MPHPSNYALQGSNCGYQCTGGKGRPYHTLYHTDHHLVVQAAADQAEPQDGVQASSDSGTNPTPTFPPTVPFKAPFSQYVEDPEDLSVAPCPDYPPFASSATPAPPCQTRFAQTSNHKFLPPMDPTYFMGYTQMMSPPGTCDSCVTAPDGQSAP